jgi:uncharacterized protein DUF6894
MPRFFFHLRKRDRELSDSEGIVLTNAAMARAQAVKTVQDFFQPSLGRIDPEWKTWSLAVCDEKGRCVWAMDFTAAGALSHRDDIVPSAQPGPRVVYLEPERLRRSLSTLMNRMRDIFEHKAVLLDHNRYEAGNLRLQLRASELVRQQAMEIVARSQRQSQANPLWGNAAWSAGHGG